MAVLFHVGFLDESQRAERLTIIADAWCTNAHLLWRGVRDETHYSLDLERVPARKIKECPENGVVQGLPQLGILGAL